MRVVETKAKVQIVEQGFDVGDRAHNATVQFSDEDDPTRESYSIGLFKTRGDAKRAVQAEVAKRSSSETRDGWWGGDVEEGRIVSQGFNDDQYGWVDDWSFERDDRVETIWMHAGLAWNE